MIRSLFFYYLSFSFNWKKKVKNWNKINRENAGKNENKANVNGEVAGLTIILENLFILLTFKEFENEVDKKGKKVNLQTRK